MLGCWLAASPFIFNHDPSARALWVNDFVCAGLIITIAALSFFRPIRRVHLLQLAVAGWLVGFGYLAQSPPVPGGLQNDMIVGLILLMLGIAPPDADRPPRGWRRAWVPLHPSNDERQSSD